MQSGSQTAPFGAALKSWRSKRRMSQLDLALGAGVSSRHVAFLETGRARPSRAMVAQLGEALGVPRAERNQMLHAAGYSPSWRTRDLDEAEMAPIRQAIARMIERHEPFPAFAIDRHWNVISANKTGWQVLAVFSVIEGNSLLEALIKPSVGPLLIENWPEVAAHFLARLRTESMHVGGDPVLDDAIARLAADPALAHTNALTDMPAVVPTRYKIGDRVYSVFSTIAQFGTAEDIALADLRIELLFPANDETAQLFGGT
jgi:transcriptional regulator with XRE-family HTH domain